MTAQPNILEGLAQAAAKESGTSGPTPAPTPAPAPTPVPTPTPTPPAEPVASEQQQKRSLEDLLADLDEDKRQIVLGEVNKARGEAQGLRKRLKDAEPQLAQYQALVEASKTDADRAQEALAATEARATAANQRVARAEIKAALSGVIDNPDTIIEDLDLARFVDEAGDVDAFAVDALKQKYAAFSGRRAPRPDPSQGSGSREGAATGDAATDFANVLQAALRG